MANATPPGTSTPISDIINLLQQAVDSASTNASTSALWSRLAGIVTGTGIVAFVARIVERTIPSGDRRLQETAEKRRDTFSRLDDLEDQNAQLRKDWADAERRCLEWQQKYVELQRSSVQSSATETLVRKNLEYPGAALVPVAPTPPVTDPDPPIVSTEDKP